MAKVEKKSACQRSAQPSLDSLTGTAELFACLNEDLPGFRGRFYKASQRHVDLLHEIRRLTSDHLCSRYLRDRFDRRVVLTRLTTAWGSTEEFTPERKRRRMSVSIPSVFARVTFVSHRRSRSVRRSDCNRTSVSVHQQCTHERHRSTEHRASDHRCDLCNRRER